jgi:hypothetical protein
MLDDSSRLREHDPKDMLGLVRAFPHQFRVRPGRRPSGLETLPPAGGRWRRRAAPPLRRHARRRAGHGGVQVTVVRLQAGGCPPGVAAGQLLFRRHRGDAFRLRQRGRTRALPRGSDLRRQTGRAGRARRRAGARGAGRLSAARRGRLHLRRRRRGGARAGGPDDRQRGRAGGPRAAGRHAGGRCGGLGARRAGGAEPGQAGGPRAARAVARALFRCRAARDGHAALAHPAQRERQGALPTRRCRR